MEEEYNYCLDDFVNRTSRLPRIQMMNALHLSPQEFQEIIIGGGFRNAAARVFNSIWNSMTDESKVDFYNRVKNGDDE